MDTIFINSENSKTFQPHVLLLKLTDKLSCLRRGEKIIALLNLSIYYTWQNIKRSYNNNKFEISAPTWNDNLNYLMGEILHQILKIILRTVLKNMEKILINRQYRYMSIKLKIGLHLKLKMDAVLNF